MMADGYSKGKKFILDLSDIGGGMYLATYAAVAFLAMQDAATKDDLPLKINTAFRSMEHQTRLFKQYVKDLAAYTRGERDKKPAPVAKPGFSTHQSGISVDINRAHDQGKTDRWLAKNAAKFGFVNDVKSELWHWSYLPERANGQS